ncbi:MAG: tRNA (cytidine(56)-2'-O)-methyltransferase [Candidatus Micrarchaeia archaeon]
MAVTVLRLGHRIRRDARLTTHVALVARAFGADACIVAGDTDSELIDRVMGLVKKWGGSFEIRQEKNWKKTVQDFKKMGYCVVHLTMYGERINERIAELRKRARVLVVVGSEKVPAEMYELADYNISVTNQPHSEVAALAVFLHEFFEGRELEKEFPGAAIAIVPSARGKRVVQPRSIGKA